ncbi:MAG: putative transposase [bacterium]
MIGTSSWIYNHCIALQKRFYRIFGKSIHKFKLQSHITKLKKRKRYSSWKQVPSQAIQNIPERIAFGYQKFFRKENSRPPKFRKRSKYKSFTLKQSGYKLLDGNKIRIGKKVFKFFKSREIEGAIKTVTIKRDTLGDLYLFFSCDLGELNPKRTMTGKTAGFDFGLKTFLTVSIEDDIQAPLYFKESLKEITKASQEFSSKQNGSGHQESAKLNLARTHIKVANRRRDYHFKLAKSLVDKYDYLFFEDLDLNKMKKSWGRKISDLGFSEFLLILEHQAKKAGAVVHKIDRFFPSTKQCNECKKLNHAITLLDRTWTCECGVFHHRDKTASINIHMEGLTSIGLG